MAQSSIYGILKNNIPYRNLWVGRTGRSLGAWIYRITLLTYAVRTLPHGTGIAWILLASGLPAVIISPWAGPIIDGIDQRRLLIGGNFILAAVTLGLFALAQVGHDIFLVFFTVVLLSVGNVFPGIAGTTFTTRIVSREDLPHVRGLAGITDGAIMLTGALIGGVIVTITSVADGFLIAAISYLWYAVWSMTLPQLVRALPGADRPKKGRNLYFKQLREGFVQAWVNPVVMLVLGLGISWGIIGGSYYVLLSYVGSGALAANAAGIGLFYALDGVGYMIGGGIAGQWLGSHDKISRIAIVGAYLLQSVFLIFFARSSHLDMAILWLLIMRIASGIVVTLDQLMLQLGVAQEYQGRIIALHSGLYGILMQGSYLVGGWGITALGAPMLGTLLAAISGIIGLFVVITALKKGLLRDTRHDGLNRSI